MRQVIIDDYEAIGETRKLTRRLVKVDKNDNFPDGLEFSLQFLYLKEDRWQQIARIDNQLHEGRAGAHIHILKRKDVKWVNITFEEAKEEILKIAENIIKNIVDKI